MTALNVELFTGRVRRADRDISLRASEWELLWALVLPDRPVPRTELAVTLRPDADEDHALGALDVRVHRLRARVGSDAIVRTAWGYRVAETADVDLRTYERFVRELESSSAETAPEQLQRCGELYDVLAASRMPAFVAGSDFATTVERRFDAVLRRLEDRLARHALAHGRPRDALSIAERALARDFCDEWAWDVAIRAHLALGDLSSAARDFRRYSTALAAELDVEPSAELRELVRSSTSSLGR